MKTCKPILNFQLLNTVKKITLSLYVSVDNENKHFVNQIVLKILMNRILIFNDWSDNNKYLSFKGGV